VGVDHRSRARWVRRGGEGARAASAGTFLLYAAHIAAMAPATHVGAATPVAVGGFPGSADGDTSALERKALEDAAAGLRSLAELRGREVRFADQAVRSGASISKLRSAAEILATEPQALQLRYLGTIADIGGKGNTIVFLPLPLELLRAFMPSDAKQKPKPVDEPEATKVH
jgi:membrane-bound serine protease (ClpP class)